MGTILTEFDLGLLTGEEARFLLEWFDELCFTQRKTYDEYYFEPDNKTLLLSLYDLILLARQFKVQVYPHKALVTGE